MRALTPAAHVAVRTLRRISHSVSYEEARELKEVIDLIVERDAEIRKYREQTFAKREYELDCG